MIFCLDARTATDHFPGIGRYVSNLSQAMAEHLTGDEQLLLIRDPATPTRWQLPPPQPGRVTVFDAAVSPFGLPQQRLIPRYLRDQQVGVYHSPYYLMPYWPGVPTVVTIYDLIPQHYPKYVSVRARLLFRVMTTLAMRAASHIVVISEATRRDLLAAYDHLPPERVTAIPLAPAPSFRPQPTEETARVRQKYTLPESFVLYVGINKPHKNLVRLLDAWKQIETESTLVIAGAWDARYPEAKDHAGLLRLDSVRFLGPIDDGDLPALYAAATVFVFPSMYEGFGLPVIEAMACGTAVACANTSSLPEAAGDAGLLFDPTHPGAIASALERLLADESLRMGMQNRGIAQAKKFTWARTAKAALNVYRA
ncbi:MAG: glycosyltransferase family 4 protein, partial [Anaerolineales bacterium]